MEAKASRSVVSLINEFMGHKVLALGVPPLGQLGSRLRHMAKEGAKITRLGYKTDQRGGHYSLKRDILFMGKLFCEKMNENLPMY